MLLGSGGQPDHVGLHGDEPVFVQDLPVVVELPCVNPGGEGECHFAVLAAFLHQPGHKPGIHTSCPDNLRERSVRNNGLGKNSHGSAQEQDPGLQEKQVGRWAWRPGQIEREGMAGRLINYKETVKHGQ